MSVGYMSLSAQEKPILKKEFLYDTFLLFRAHPTTLLLKILGGRIMAVPHLKFRGDRLPSPPRFSPLSVALQILLSSVSILSRAGKNLRDF